MEVTFNVPKDIMEGLLCSVLDKYVVDKEDVVEPKSNFTYNGDRYSIHENMCTTGAKYFLEIASGNCSDEVLFDSIKKTKFGKRKAWVLHRQGSSVLSLIEEQVSDDFCNALDNLCEYDA